MTRPTNWQISPQARLILTHIDALEHRMDEAPSLNWEWLVDGAMKQHCDLRCDLDCIRAQAIGDYADAFGQLGSEEHDNAWIEADDEAESIESAIETARKLRLGGTIFQMEAA